MKHITSPYNFAPIAREVFYPDWADRVSHDIPFSDGEDGIIDVTLENVSPLFTRNGSTTKDEEYSAHIDTPDGKLYFIPGSTVKGMLRNLVSIMSFGKMQEDVDYKNRYFGWRDVGGQTEKKKEYRGAMQNAKPGWLKKEPDGSYTFTPCLGEYGKLSNVWIAKKYPAYATAASSYAANEALGWFPGHEENGVQYKIVCTGKFDSKRHELLFPAETGDPITLKPETVKSFLTVYENTPDFMPAKKGAPCWKARLEDGKSIPVFGRLLQREGEVIGMGRMFKQPCRYGVKEQVAALQRSDVTRRDLAEVMFGTIQGNALKGRVHVGHAFMPHTLPDTALLPLQTENLGSPRASFYPLYLQQSKETGQYQNYDDPVGVAGRKLYRIHKGSNTSSLPKTENENVSTRFRPLPTAQTFRLRIAVHNIRKVELGALLAALTLNGTEGLFHNLGMAKSLGYGKVKVNEVTLRGFLHDVADYISEYETEMTVFARRPWKDTPAVRAVASILSEHSDDVVKTMELGEYTASKALAVKVSNNKERFAFTLLNEQEDASRQFVSYSKPEDAARREFAAETAAARALAESIKTPLLDKDNPALFIEEAERVMPQLQNARQRYDALLYKMTMRSVPCEEEKQQAEELQRQIDGLEGAIAEAQNLIAQAAREAKLTAGLAAVLDEKFEQGPNTGDYKVKDWKVCKKKVDKWLKDKGATSLDEEEQAALAETIKRLRLAPTKKEEIKEWSNLGSRRWSEIAHLLGEEQTEKLKQ